MEDRAIATFAIIGFIFIASLVIVILYAIGSAIVENARDSSRERKSRMERHLEELEARVSKLERGGE